MTPSLPRALLSGLALALAVGGCAAQTGSPDGDVASADLLSRSVDYNNVLSDEQLTGDADVTAAHVQAFLEGHGSYLATYRDSGSRQSAAQLIVASSQTHGVSAVYLLARIQVESSLIESGTARSLAAATGCACPDGAACARANKGFAAQVDCAAATIAAYLNELDTQGETRSAIKVGSANRTHSLDGCKLAPKNRATAALYTYTPWVGIYGAGCGSRTTLGTTFLAKQYATYKASPALATTSL